MIHKSNNRIFRRYLALIAVSFLLISGRQAFASVLSPGVITTCGEIVYQGAGVYTYTLGSNVSTSTGPCFTITASGPAADTVIDGAGKYTITGDVVGDGTSAGSPGYNFTLQNVTVTGNVTANGASRSSGTGAAGAGGNIAVSNSTTTTITSNGGSRSGSGTYYGGAGGSIIISNSTTTAVTSTGGVRTGGSSGAYGGSGGGITVIGSSVTSLSSNGGNGGSYHGGSGGAIVISSSTITSVLSNGGTGNRGGSGGSITISNSMTTTVASNGGSSNGYAGGSGGSIVINSALLNINGLDISSLGASGSSNGANGTLTFNYTTIQYSNLTLSVLSNLTFNDPNNLPGSLGSFAGGIYPTIAMATLSPGTINSCGYIYSAGTYTLGSSLDMNGACLTILSGGVIIDGGDNGSGGHYTITGNVSADATTSGSSGFGLTMRDIAVVGTTSSDGASDGGSCSTGGGNGGNIIMSTSTSSVITADAGDTTYFGCNPNSVSGGNGGSITLSGTNVDLSDKTMSVRGGYGNYGGSGTTNGTITVDYTDTLDITGIHISPVSDLTINSPLDTPGSLGASDGGIIGTLPGGTVQNSSQCNLALAGTYTLGATIAGDCDITADNIVIKGAGHTITGQVNGSSPDSYINGHSFTLQNMTVAGTITSAGIYGILGNNSANCFVPFTPALSGGDITITDSTTTSIIADGSSPQDYNLNICGILGVAGSVNMTDSKFTSISSQGAWGGASLTEGLDNIVTISGDTLDLSSARIITADGHIGSELNLNYNNLITDSSTFFGGNGASPLIVNGFSFGDFSGVYNPSGSGSYFDDKQSHDGNWNDPLNWWSDASATILSGVVPTGLSQYTVNSSVTENTGNSPITANTVTFNNGAINAIDIDATRVIFNDTSSNMGTITGGQAIFNGNQSENASTSSLFVFNQHGSDAFYTSITSSADGTRLAAVDIAGNIYISSDFGATWAESASLPSVGSNQTSITSSADGSRLAITAPGSQIYTSADYGATWTAHGPTREWSSVTSSSDGTKLAASATTIRNVDDDPAYVGGIYTSTDSGVTWTASTSSPPIIPWSQNQVVPPSWDSVASSPDGTMLIAVDSGGTYISNDSGATWALSASSPSVYQFIYTSDGTKLIGIGAHNVYTSADFGTTWTSIVSSPSLPSGVKIVATASADGTKLVAVASYYYDPIYISNDSGATWSPYGSNQSWTAVTSSADGTKIAAVTGYSGNSSGGQIYTMSNTPTTVHRSGTIASSTPIRQYTTNTVVGTRDFTNTGSNWIVQADGASVDLSSSIYNTSINIFQQLLGGSFTANSSINGGAPVVPQVSISSPANSASPAVVKWLPSVSWDTSTLCQYSYDDFTTMHTVDCSKNGSDIGKPSGAGTQTLYVQGTDNRGDLTQKSATFSYDDTSPVYTSCGGDLLDESTRQYYYLEGNVMGNCVATADVELRGTTTPNVVGFTVNGNITATTNGNGHSIILKDVIVTGSVNASGADNSSGTGYNGGNITIDPSVTGNVVANGGNSPTKGGNGGTVNISDSGGIASSTTVSANGGDATSCGYGGSGGPVNLVNSAYGTVTNGSGKDMTKTFAYGGYCPNVPSGIPSNSGSISSSGQYIPPVLSLASMVPAKPVEPEDKSVVTPVASPSPSPSPSSIGGVSGRFSNIVSNISNTASTSIASVKKNIVTLESLVPVAVKAVVNTANTVVNSQTSKAVQTTGFFAGLVASVAMYTDTGLATPWAASEIFLIPVKLWGLILVGLGIRKKTRPWGTVYDSVTKQPIDPAFVTARDANGKVVAEAITDIDGRYGFLLPDGTYYISVKKTNYEFPSKKLTGKSSDELYGNLYFGEPVTIRGGEVLDKNIPLDQKNFDWNEYAKIEHHATLFHSRHEKAVAIAGNYIYGIGLAISIIAVFVKHSAYNISVLVIYVLVMAFLKFGMKKKKLGYILDKTTNEPLAYAIIRVTTLDHQVTLRSGVCDAHGRYYCIVPKGDYYVDIEKKNPDGSYAKIYESPQISSSSGIINKDFKV